MGVTLDLDRIYSPDELLELSDEDRFELAGGRPVGPEVSAMSNWVELKVGRRLDEHVSAGGLGWVLPASQLYRCFPHRPSLMRRPDASFLAAGRFGLSDLTTTSVISVAPDLAVEIVSPNDEAEELENKVYDYFAAGTRLVWLVYPRIRRAIIRRADGTVSAIDEEGRLDGESVLPGLSIRLGDVLPPPLPEPDSGVAPLM